MVIDSLADMLKRRERGARTRRLFVEMSVLLSFVTSFFFISTSINSTDQAFQTTSPILDLLLGCPDWAQNDNGKCLLQLGGTVEEEDDRRRLSEAGPESSTARRRRLAERIRRLSEEDAAINGSAPMRSRNRRQLRAAGGGGDDVELTYFDELLDRNDVWTFLRDGLGDNLLAEDPLRQCRAGDGVPGSGCENHQRYMLQTQRLIGSIRLSQARVESGSSDGETSSALGGEADVGGCNVPAIYSSESLVKTRSGEASTIIIPACYPNHNELFASWNTSAFGLCGGETCPNTTTPPFPLDTADPILETSLSQIAPTFVIDLPNDINLTTWHETMDDLRFKGYIDAYTRYLYVSINAYNVATDLFVAVELQIKFAHSGGAWTDYRARTLAYSKHLQWLCGKHVKELADISSPELKLLILEMIFVFFLIASLATQFSAFSEQGLAYLIVPYNWLAFCNVMLFIWIEGRRYLLLDQLVGDGGVIDEYEKFRSPDRFVPLYPLAEEAFVTQNLLAVNTLMMMTVVFKFFGLSPRLDLLIETLSLASTEMFWFLIFFVTLLFSWAAAFHLSFGMDVLAFNSFSDSIITLLMLLLGQFNYDVPLSNYNGYLGPALFWSYVIIVATLMLSSFVAIIEEAFGQAKEDAKERYDQLADILLARTRDYTRFLRLRGRKVQAYAQKTRSTSISSSRRLTLRVRDTTDPNNQIGFSQMSSTIRGLLSRATGGVVKRPEDDRLQRAAWVELNHRHKITRDLMSRLQKARKHQCQLLEKMSTQQEQQMAQLEELSTQLWNAWQLVADASQPADASGRGARSKGGA